MKFLSHKILVVTIALLLSVASPGCAQFFVFENPLVGEQAPEFKLPTLNGEEMSMTDYRAGQSAIIFFWATWCPHCRSQLKVLNDRKEELTKKGIKIVLVDLQEPPQQVSSYLKKNKIDFNVFLDNNQAVSERYALVGVPTFIFVNKEGIIRAVEHEIPSNFEEILASSAKK